MLSVSAARRGYLRAAAPATGEISGQIAAGDTGDDPHELLRLRQVAGHAALHVPSLGCDSLGDFPDDRSLDDAVVDDASGPGLVPERQTILRGVEPSSSHRAVNLHYLH